MNEFTLPAGTVCHRNGIPFELSNDTVIRTNDANWPLMQEPEWPENGRPFPWNQAESWADLMSRHSTKA